MPDRETINGGLGSTHDLSAEELEQETRIYRFLHQGNIVRDAARRLQRKGSELSLTMKGEKGSPLEMDMRTPHLQTVTELAVTLEPLIRDSSGIYYKAILELCAETNPSAALDALVSTAEEAVEKIRKGPIRVQLGTETRSAGEIYERFMDRLINAPDVQANEYQKNLDRNPPARDLLMFQFYNYCLEMGRFVLWLQSAIKTGGFLPDGAPRDFVCIICKQTGGTRKFSKAEHTLPESLGNAHSVLPRGYSCDACQDLMAPIEGQVVESLPFAITRLWFTHYTKAGKFPSAKLGTVHYTKVSPNQIRVDFYAGKSGFPKSTDRVDGSVELSLTGSSKFDHIALGRVLIKATLGAMALERGRDYVLDSRFDPAREFVRTGKGLQARLFMTRKAVPDPGLAIRWWDLDEARVAVVALIHGIEFAFPTTPASYEAPPPPEALEELEVFDLWRSSPTPHYRRPRQSPDRELGESSPS